MDSEQMIGTSPKCCAIVGSSDINNYAFIRESQNLNDYIIFCDSGLKHLDLLQFKSCLIVGDFDSHEIRILTWKPSFSRVKKTIQIRFFCKRSSQASYEDFLLIGVVGARLDHTLGNVSILLYMDSLGYH